MIRLKDGDVINTEMSPEMIAKTLNKQDFIVIGWKWFNKYEVKTFEEYNPTDIDCFILMQSKTHKEKLSPIIAQRKAEWKRVTIKIVQSIIDKFQNGTYNEEYTEM